MQAVQLACCDTVGRAGWRKGGGAGCATKSSGFRCARCAPDAGTNLILFREDLEEHVPESVLRQLSQRERRRAAGMGLNVGSGARVQMRCRHGGLSSANAS
jgi:hypothetical protein